MAVAYRSSTKAEKSYGSGNLTLTEPASAASGDYLIAFVWVSEGTGEPPTMSSDWTRIHNSLSRHADASYGPWTQAAFFHERGASAPASLVVTNNAGSNTMSGVCVAVSGAAASLIPQVSADISAGDVTRLQVTIDSLDADCLFVGAHGSEVGSASAADFNSTMTEAEDNEQVESDAHGPTLAGYDDPAATGAQTYDHDGPSGVYSAVQIGMYGTAPDYATGDNGYVVSESSSGDDSWDTPNITVPEPAGAAEGDVFVALISTAEGGGAGGLPSGWTSLDTGALASDGDYRIGYITRGASAPSMVFTRNGTQGIFVHVYCVRGCSGPAIKYDVATGTATTLTTTAVDCSDGGAVLGFYAGADGATCVSTVRASTTGFRQGDCAVLDENWGMSGSAHLVGAAPSATQTVSFVRDASANVNAAAILVYVPYNVTKTVDQTAGDYSTVQSAVDDCSVEIGPNGWYKVEITDAASYDENVSIAAAEITTPTASHYLWLTAASGVRHSGAGAATGHARIHNASGHVIESDIDYMRISWLDIHSTSTATSDEGIRFTAGGNNSDILVQYCIIRGEDNSTQQDGIYVGNWDLSTLHVDNCVITGWTRGGIHMQQYGAFTNATQAVTVSHCAFYLNGDHIVIDQSDSGETTTCTIYNSVGDGGGVMVKEAVGSGGTIITVNGTHNAAKSTANDVAATVTDNTTNWTYFGNDITVTTTTSDAWIVTDITSATQIDLTPVAATGGGANDILEAGTNRQASEPDSRQDFSVDITGSERPTTNVDIGAFQISTVGAVTGAAALTGSATVAVAGTRTIYGAVALTGSATLAVAGTRTTYGAAALTGSATLAVAGTRATTGAAALTGSATLTVAGTRSTTGAAALTGSATLAVAGTRTAPGAAALTGTATLVVAGTGSGSVTGAAALTGSATVAVAGTRTTYGAAALTGSATLVVAGTGSGAVTGAAALTGSATLAVAGTRITYGTAALTGSASLAVAGTRTIYGAAALTGSAALVVAGTRSTTGAAALTGTATIAVTGTRTAPGAAALTGTATLAVAGQRTAYGTATLTGTATLNVAGVKTSYGTVTLTGTATIVVQGGSTVALIRITGIYTLELDGESELSYDQYGILDYEDLSVVPVAQLQ